MKRPFSSGVQAHRRSTAVVTPIPNATTAPAAITVSATIVTAKLTPGGANGSMTFTNGVLTAQTPAT